VGHAHTRLRPGRLPFSAELRATDCSSGREVWGETTNLGRGGCYVRLGQPFPQGTLLLIEIRNHRVRFQTDARVAYTIEKDGMGLSFVNVPASQLPILAEWLAYTGEERTTEVTREASE
jgi:hypothetical protein